MRYLKKWVQEDINYMKWNFDLPNDWNEFLTEVEKNHNLIIKNPKNICYCTNCSNSFEKDLKIGKEYRCPNCKNKYLVKSHKLRHFHYTDQICMIDKVYSSNHLILRIFELRSEYNGEKQEFEYDVVEFSRKFINDNFREIRNDRCSIAMCGPWVLHNREEGRWRTYDGYYHYTMPSGFIYINNMEQVLKNTKYEYSRMWKVFRNNTTQYYNLEDIFEIADRHSFEMLVELGLYNLAFAARQFVDTGTFRHIFGVDKTYYNFIKEHDLTWPQLKILRMYPTKNIRTIKFLEKFNLGELKAIKELTTIDNFIKYFRKKRYKDSRLYFDYLDFCKKLGYDLKNKKYLFPNNLKQKHDEFANQIKILEKEQNNKLIAERYKELLNKIFESKKYIIFPAQSVEELIDESSQQNNCVKTYVERYANGDCDIYFMRLSCEKDKSLVTVEVRNNKVVQKRIKNNAQTTKEQDKFLQKWEDTILNKNERVIEYAAV